MTILHQQARTLTDVLRAGDVSSVFQPIVDLTTTAVVGYEALARGPHGDLASPDRLFAAAGEQSLTAELDHACQLAAFAGARAHGLTAPLTVFVNVEPDALTTDPTPAMIAEYRRLTRGLRVMVEFTERALGARPADLLRSVGRVRALGWEVALDDVGADPMSLAFMALLRPDVVKLDLRLVQQQPDRQVAHIMNAVNAYAERSGALILAEGIETDHHLMLARALGARLGQGWLFGRPTANPAPATTGPGLRLTPQPWQQSTTGSPFGCLRPEVALRLAPKALLIEVSKHLECEVIRLGPTAVVAAAFQRVENFTPATARRYRKLADRVGFVCVLAQDMPATPVPGIRGVPLTPDDPVRGEWNVVILDPHFAVALLARDLGDHGPDRDRRFEFVLTYDRPTVEHAAHTLISRVTPNRSNPAT